MSEVWIHEEDGLRNLEDGLCPFCCQPLDDNHTFKQEDGREGGLAHCNKCRHRLAWINKPFEYEVKDDE